MILFCIILLTIAIAVICLLIHKIKKQKAHICDTERYYKSILREQAKKTNTEINSLLKQIAERTQLFESEKAKSDRLQEIISNTKCLICKEPSNGKHYCYSCYSKYKNGSIDVRITNCLDIKIIDLYGNKSYRGGDGRMYRSRAEALISHYLFDNGIRYIYEKPIFYMENGLNKTLHPDFFLPDYNVYIEYNELEEREYINSKLYAMKVYKQKGLRVIIITQKELSDIASFLMPQLS